MTANLDADVYTKTRNHRKKIRKTQKEQCTKNQKNIKHRNINQVRALFLHIACLAWRRAVRTPAPTSVTPLWIRPVNQDCPFPSQSALRKLIIRRVMSWRRHSLSSDFRTQDFYIWH